MDDKEKEERKNSIRVVDDSPEEVVRLESGPKRVRLDLKGGVSAEAIEAQHQDAVSELGDGKEVQESRPFDPERKWAEEDGEDGAKVAPMGWFYLLGAILLGVVAWVGFQNFLPADDSDKGGGRATPSSQTTLLEEVEKDRSRAQDLKEAEEHFTRTEEVVRGFLEASSLEERVKFVRHPERVLPLMRDYYSKNEFQQATFKRIGRYEVFPLANFPFLAINAIDEEGKDNPILLEDGEDGILADWESYVCYQPVVLEDYVNARPPESVSLRVYVTVDNFHSYEFDNTNEYLSFRLAFRSSEIRLNGYVKRGTELEQKFRTVFPGLRMTQLAPLILKVRFLEGGRARDSVLIEELESTRWAYPKNPDEVASSQKED